MRILVIEDEPYIADVISKSLERIGIDCLHAGSVDEADQLLGEQPIDAVTLDLGMPGRGGLTWLESIAERDPELARKTIVITGTTLESELVERLARCGAGILAKPFTLDSLHEAVRCQMTRTGLPLNRPN